MGAGAPELLALPGDQLVQRLALASLGGEHHLALLPLELVLQPPPILEAFGIIGLEGGVIGVRPLSWGDDIAFRLGRLGLREGAARVDQPREPKARDACRGQGLSAAQAFAGGCDQGVVVGEGRTDRLCDGAWTAMEGQEAHRLALPMQHRHARVRPRLADQTGELRAEQRIAEGRLGRAEAAPGLDLAFA